jgi:hypothetical protein
MGLSPPMPTLPTRTSRETRRLYENGDAQYFTRPNLKAAPDQRNQSGHVLIFGFLRLRREFIEETFHRWQILEVEKADVNNHAHD